jgi:dihydropteroate synthase
MLQSPAPTHWAGHELVWGARTFVMGILNITPDSFSNDGLAPNGVAIPSVVEAAVQQARQMAEAGADLLDVGGESTRPEAQNASPLDAQVERDRVVPVIEALADALPAQVSISIDTYKAKVADAALAAGASLVNDIWGLQRDPDMAHLVATRGVPVVLMSNLRGARRHDAFGDVTRYLAQSIELALGVGIPWDHLIVDPGIGFGLSAEENLEVLRRLRELRALGRPILVGTSRKSTIGRVLGGLPADDRIEGTAATVALSIAGGADMVRVHDVQPMVRVVRMADAIVRGWAQ